MRRRKLRLSLSFLLRAADPENDLDSPTHSTGRRASPVILGPRGEDLSIASFPPPTFHKSFETGGFLCAVFLIWRGKVLLFQLDERWGKAAGTWCPPSLLVASNKQRYTTGESTFVEEGRAIARRTLKEDTGLELPGYRFRSVAWILGTSAVEDTYHGFMVRWNEDHDGPLPTISLPVGAVGYDFFDPAQPPNMEDTYEYTLPFVIEEIS